MSLINKMLQDLDARGGANDAALQQEELKAVPMVERDRRPMMLAGAGVAVVVLAAGGWYGWQYWQSHRAPPGPVPKVVDNRIPNRPRLQEPPPEMAMPGAENSSAAAAASMAAVAPNVTKPGSPVAVVAPAPAVAQADHGEAEQGAIAKPAKPHAAGDGQARERGGARQGSSAMSGARDGVAAGNGTSELTPKQVAENTYRRALTTLQEGRVTTAMADLERALEIDPRNEAARQTYVSLLLENKRGDEAVRQLRLALGIDPRQPGLAMVLARLQLERGGPALETLMKTLPYAGNNADYHAFLAGVLQREQRHEEAAQHYRDALKMSPQNGVWWMGLGISLQADQHLPEAREAFTRARNTATLTPELQAFVERKLEQLSR
jgi:MSHA biogenesis protein MshN